MLLLTVISLAPAVLLMTTSFIRILVVLGLLRQALGTQQLPPSQVITSIALFMTVLLMTPVWTEVYDEAIKPYTEKQIDLDQAWERGTLPVRKFMAEQIHRTENHDDVHLFLSHMPGEYDEETGELPEYFYYESTSDDEKIVPAASIATCIYVERTEDRVSDWLPDLLAISCSRYRRSQCHDFDGHADVATGTDFVAV